MEKIDFIITWVDSSDQKWIEEKNKYEITNDLKKVDARNNRYRDMNCLKYWFRGVEKYAPWVNKIFFVTYGHYPEWLNIDNKKIKIIKHSEFIPEKFLPTFNSNAIGLLKSYPAACFVDLLGKAISEYKHFPFKSFSYCS